MNDIPASARWDGRRGAAWSILRKHLRRPADTVAAGIFFLILTLVALGGTLWQRDRILSGAEGDLASQFIHWRKFGFDQLRTGNLALWNPHIFCGTPFLGGFQSALLYPPNWLYLVLPLAVAINTGIALHVFLAGIGMFLWTRQRGLHPVAAAFAGVLFMFSGPYFPHIHAGHLPNLCTMAWGPFIFLAIDGWLQRRTLGWLLLGGASVAMQILAGHPQYVFYTGVAAALYCAVQVATATRRINAMVGLAVIALVGVALSAAQLFEGIHAASESVRNHGTPFEFAAVFSFPPENLLTLLTPNFFGDLGAHEYWGRWYLWEMSAFFGVSGVVMAIYALARAPRCAVWSCASVAFCLLVLALGNLTPLFGWLYHYAPGFGSFRGWSKFIFPAVMLMVVVAATGFDVLLRKGISGSRLPAFALVAGGAAVFAAAWTSWISRESATGAPEPWHHWIRLLVNTGDDYLSYAASNDPGFTREAAHFAATQMLLAGATLLALASIFAASRRYPGMIYGLLGVAVVEMLFYAHSTLDSFRLRDVFAKPDVRFLVSHPSDGLRVFNGYNHNLAMSLQAYDLWGYDPGVLRRYAEWIAVSQGREPDDATETMRFVGFPPQFATMLRCRYLIPLPDSSGPATGGKQALAKGYANVPPASRIFLVPQVKVISDRNKEMSAIFGGDFDPAREVILESPPVPVPAGGDATPGTTKLVGETTDTLTIEANLAAPEVLVVTDTYSDGWKARSLLPPGDAPAGQVRYEVMPADYCLRAVPLSAGHHRILLEYRPTAFVVGKWTSLVSLGLFGLAMATWIARRALQTNSAENRTTPAPNPSSTAPFQTSSLAPRGQ